MRTFFLILLLVNISGCATIISQSDGHDDDVIMCHPEQGFSAIYSGTKLDTYCLYIGADNAAFFCLLDLPLSLVADTLILPYTIYSEVTGTRYCPAYKVKDKTDDAPKRYHRPDEPSLTQDAT